MKKVIFVLLVLLSQDFWSNRFWLDLPFSPIIKQIIGFVLLLFSVFYLKKNKQIFFRNELILFLLTFAFAAISSYILYQQSLFLSLKGSMEYTFPVGIFLLAHKYKLSFNFILRFLLIYSFVFTFIEIFEQFTYPEYWFCGRVEKEGAMFVEERMGLWRMYIFGIYLCLLAFTIVLQRIVEGKDLTKNFVIITILFVGIVFFVARKDIFAAISVMIIAFVFGKGKFRVNSKVIVIILLIGTIFVLPTLMSDLIEQTQAEVGDEDFIRYVAAFYFLFEMNTSPLYYLFGAGIATSDSALYTLITDMAELNGIYQEDCGFVGYFSKVGLVGLLPYILIFYKVIKNRKFVDLFTFLFMIIMLELSFFDFWGNQWRNVASTMVFLYLTEITIVKNMWNYKNVNINSRSNIISQT